MGGKSAPLALASAFRNFWRRYDFNHGLNRRCDLLRLTGRQSRAGVSVDQPGELVDPVLLEQIEIDRRDWALRLRPAQFLDEPGQAVRSVFQNRRRAVV